MKRNEPVSHIMTKNPFSVQRGQKVSDVRHVLVERNVHHVPVLDGKKLVGMMSMMDMMRLSWGAQDGRTMDALLDHTVTLNDVMAKEPVRIRQGHSIREAAELLSGGQFHALPVVGDDDELVGILSSTDLIRYLIEQY